MKPPLAATFDTAAPARHKQEASKRLDAARLDCDEAANRSWEEQANAVEGLLHAVAVVEEWSA